MRPPSYTLLENLKRIMRSIKFFGKRKRSLRTTAYDSTMYWDCEKHGEPSSREVYLPARVWDALNPSERYASVADLCAHAGEQLPIQIVKLIARDILRELEKLHALSGTHGDINPNTILLSPTDMRCLIFEFCNGSQTSLALSESSAGTLFDEFLASADSNPIFRLSTVPTVPEDGYYLTYADSPALHAPEYILGGPCDSSTDIWSLGCVLFELLTGEALFDPQFQTVELGLSSDESHLIQIIELFGTFPLDMVLSGKYSQRWFTQEGNLKIDTTYYPISLATVLQRKIARRDVVGTAAFLDGLLQLQPDHREKPKDIVNHLWFVT